MSEPRVSVIIPTRDRRDLLAAALDSLDRLQADPGEVEVRVVDDGSTDGTADLLARRRGPFPVLLLRNEHPAGPAAARNRGAAGARGEVLGFLDSDILVSPGWWQAARPHFADAGVAAVEGATVTSAGSPRPGIYTHVVANPRGGSYLTCNMLYRRKVFLAAGGFDERFRRANREDTDLAFTVLERGGRIVFEPGCLVEHPLVPARRDVLYRDAAYGLHEALLRRKHPRLYRTHLKWIDGRAVPVFYWGPYLGLPVVLLGAALGSAVLVACGTVACGLGWAGAVYARCRKRDVAPGAFLRLCWQMCWVPWVRLYWVLRGEWVHRRVRPDARAI